MEHPGVLVHVGHTLTADPVGVAVRHLDARAGAVRVTIVSASGAERAWRAVRTRALPAVSTVSRTDLWRSGRVDELVCGRLVSVDLVERPANPGAWIGTVTPYAEMTPGQRRCWQRLDDYLADPGNPLVIDFLGPVRV